MRTWEQQRKEIQSQVNKFFRRQIEIAPRAMAALQVRDIVDKYTDEFPSGFEISVLESLLKSSPACATVLFKAGVQLENIKFPETRDTPARLADSTLPWIFRGVEAKVLTPTARAIRKRSKLEETDILVSALEASLQGQEPNEFGGQIVKASGIALPDEVRDWGSQVPMEWETPDTYLRNLLERIRGLATDDPNHALVQFVLYQDDKEVLRLRPFGTTGISWMLEEAPVKEGERYLYRGGVFQPIHCVAPGLSWDVLSTFEDLLNSTSASESDFQRFFEEFPFFLTGLDFRRAHPQPILYKDEGSPLVPDFFLEKLSSSWDVILDLKKPYDQMVSRRKNRVYFKQNVQNAVSQLRYYREWFDDYSHRKAFEQIYGVRTFRPRMVLVIGRDFHFRDDVERIRLCEGLQSNLDIWTYDDLYKRARRYLNLADQ